MTTLPSHLQDSPHTLSLFVANKPGVLLRVALVFSRRGYNIESLVVSPALDGRYSRMTITAKGDPTTLDQIIKQVSKLVDVVHACEHDSESMVYQELSLIKVAVGKRSRADLIQTLSHVGAEVLNIHEDVMIFKLMGESAKIDMVVDLLRDHEVLEIVRTGKVGMIKGGKAT